MNHGMHLSDLRLDQLLAGELHPPADAAMRAHLASCMACTRRHGTLLADAEQVRIDPRFAALGSAVRASLFDVVADPPARARRPWATAALAACAVMIAVIAIRHRTESGGDTGGLRIKGDLAMDVFVRRAGLAAPVETLLAGDLVHPGDQIRIRVRAAARGPFGVFAVDAPPPPAPASAVAASLPAGARLAAVDPGAPLLLDGAIQLDASLGREQLLGVLCPSSRDKDAVAGEIRAALAAAGGEPDHLDWRRAVSGCAVSSFWMRKVAP
jgi:hypothetical protein